jgi:hypothetical protein
METSKLDPSFEESLGALEERRATLEDILKANPDQAEEQRARLQAALWLHDRRPDLDPRPGYIQASRRRLVKQIEQEGRRPAGLFRRRPRWPTRETTTQRLALRLSAVLAILLALLGNSIIINAAAQASYPGEALYPVKRAEENLKLAATRSTTRQTQLHIQYTQRRAFEVEGLILEGRYEYLMDTAQALEHQVYLSLKMLETIEQSDRVQAETLTRSLENTLKGQNLALRVLVYLAPTQAQSSLLKALEASEYGRTRLRSGEPEPAEEPSPSGWIKPSFEKG